MAVSRYAYRLSARGSRAKALAAGRCGEIGAWVLNLCVAFPHFVWSEVLRPALHEARLRRVLRDETHRLFFLQGIAPLQAHRSVVFALIALLLLVVGSQAAVYGLHASVEGIAAKIVVFTLVPGFTAFYVVLGIGARWYVAMNRALGRGEDKLWRQWGAPPGLMLCGPQIAASALAAFNLSLLNLITLLFAEPMLSGIQHSLLPHLPPLDLTRHLTPGLFLLALLKAVTVATGVTAWFAFRVAAAQKPDRDLAMIVVRTTQPFVVAWLLAEAVSWWLALL